MNDASEAAALSQLEALVRAHGVAANLVDGAVQLPTNGLALRARVTPHERTLQLDVLVPLPDGRTIVETFAGVGVDPAGQLADAVQNFGRTALHVLLAATGTRTPQVTVEKWDGWTAVVGELTVRGRPPVTGPELLAWFPALRDAVRALPLPPGLHWVSFYYAQADGEPLGLEGRVDNAPELAVMKALARLKWHHAEPFYGLRLFAVLRVPQPALAN